jgi:hypothetical protein
MTKFAFSAGLMLIVLLITNSVRCSSDLPPIYLIPQTYQGFVLVLFNQSDGAKCEYENGRAVLRISDSGVLLTQCATPQVMSTGEGYYYVDSSGARSSIPLMETLPDSSQDIQIMYRSTGNTYHKGIGGGDFESFIVSNPHQVRQFFGHSGEDMIDEKIMMGR